MIFGDTGRFAIESQVDCFCRELSFRALGSFCLHINGRRFGVAQPDATYLACSYDSIVERYKQRGLHKSLLADHPSAFLLATMIERATYDSDRDGITIDGMDDEAILQEFPVSLFMAPDGDAAFDDGSHVLQLDMDNEVRLIGWIGRASHIEDLHEVRLPADEFYSILHTWHTRFLADWEAAPKKRCCPE